MEWSPLRGTQFCHLCTGSLMIYAYHPRTLLQLHSEVMTATPAWVIGALSLCHQLQIVLTLGLI